MHALWALAACFALWLNKPKNFKHFLVPVLFGFAFIVVGSAWAYYHNHCIACWWFSDVENGLVNLSPGWQNFKMTGINFLRSFIQIHGNIILFFQKCWIFIAAAGLSFSFFSLGLYFSKRITVKNHKLTPSPIFNLTILLAFIFHFGFAWFSVGNAEFMVMLPMLLLLILIRFFQFPQNLIFCFAAALFMWNSALAILPAHVFDFENLTVSKTKLLARGKHLFIANNQILLQNYYEFSTPNIWQDDSTHYYTEFTLLKSPAESESELQLKNAINNALKKQIPVYTDCIQRPSPASRKTILEKDKNTTFFSAYSVVKVDSFSTDLGEVYIHRIIK
jgi:hypothetical protein